MKSDFPLSLIFPAFHRTPSSHPAPFITSTNLIKQAAYPTPQITVFRTDDAEILIAGTLIDSPTPN